MEQITKREGLYYYGEQECLSADDAYNRFRDEYHRLLGREFYFRLNRIGKRTERVHGFGVYYDRPGYMEELGTRFKKYGRIRARLLGIVGIAYCRMVGMWDMPVIDEEDYDSWIDWLTAKGNGVLYLVGIKQKAGRTSKNKKKRYR